MRLSNNNLYNPNPRNSPFIERPTFTFSRVIECSIVYCNLVRTKVIVYIE